MRVTAQYRRYKVLNRGLYVPVGAAWHCKNLQNSNDLQCFLSQFGGLGALFGEGSAPKIPPPWRRGWFCGVIDCLKSCKAVSVPISCVILCLPRPGLHWSYRERAKRSSVGLWKYVSVGSFHRCTVELRPFQLRSLPVFWFDHRNHCGVTLVLWLGHTFRTYDLCRYLFKCNRGLS